jgi:hypothetical protein
MVKRMNKFRVSEVSSMKRGCSADLLKLLAGGSIASVISPSPAYSNCHGIGGHSPALVLSHDLLSSYQRNNQVDPETANIKNPVDVLSKDIEKVARRNNFTLCDNGLRELNPPEFKHTPVGGRTKHGK